MDLLISLVITLNIYVQTAATDTTPRGKSKVLIVLSDGMRWDHYGLSLPNFENIQKTGVKADWMDGAFVTLSTASMTTISTGLYQESHGVVHNVYYSAEYKNRTSGFFDTLNVTEWFDTGSCEPIWVTAINQGLKAGTINYPGGSVAIKGVKPTRDVPNTWWAFLNYGLEQRVNDAITWLTKDEFDLVMLYFNKPDNALHEFGIGHANTDAQLHEVDDVIGYLFDKIDKASLTDILNVIIVSDHGHVNQEVRKHVALYDYIDKADIDFVVGDYGPFVQILPKEGKLEKIYDILVEAHPALYIYKKEEFPERFHYANNPRILPIIGFVDPGWSLHLNYTPASEGWKSDHGYDNNWMLMKSIFYAKGPAFKSGYRSPNIESVNVYPLACELLGITPAANNGSRVNYVDMLRSDIGSAGYNKASKYVAWIMLIVSTIMPYL
ncbi:ectonucleotide pyrophosphatase/phosphodiesterase family member 7-like isoform X2 [Anneissia japonica]|uniref:ectonucleotide pyrophosphatase/phosphodiesterase family member 7-like isoform X2 n=1 Tax=Anneissia japonica TaxID=1529436 RepID=UPI0014256BA3|nr:ectonucleotide pyrophosphatase/phosphodiesterase family member 7-like isoform X2 [Anneissia japonica]